MRIPVFRHGQIAASAFGIGLVVVSLATMPGSSFALTPESPEVQAAIKKGVAFLESKPAEDDRIGARSLQCYCLLKYAKSDPALPKVDSTHPIIAVAVNRIQKALGTRDPAKLEAKDWDVYSTGLAIIFLVELDKEKHHADIECLLTSLQNRQKPHGGWGYPERETGDTSMTQYGVLSSWVATKAGFAVPQKSIESVATWLLRTQDPTGGFGYQGNVAPTAGALVNQSEVRPSMTAAGSGSLYICADWLDLINPKEKRKDLPTALKEVKSKDAPKDRPKTSKIELRAVHEAEDRSKQWMAANNKIEGMQWAHYYLYALERCMAFRDKFDHRDEAEPQWYNEGAAFLLKTQTESGNWSGQCGTVPDTAFSILFLMRNTRKMAKIVEVYTKSTMVGGRGIPPDTRNILVKANGQIVARPLVSASDDLLVQIEKQGGREFDKAVSVLAELPGSQLEALTAKYGARIRDLVGNKSPEARLAAVQALGKARDLDNVETLIYALTDPDPRVVRAANDGLLRMRRISTEVTLPENFSEEDRRFLVERWKAWYQSIRPGVDMR